MSGGRCSASGAREGLGVARARQPLPSAPAWWWALPALTPPGGQPCLPPFPPLQGGSHQKPPQSHPAERAKKSQLDAALGTPRQCPNGVPEASESHLPGDWATAGQVFYWRSTDTRAPRRVTAWRRRRRGGSEPPDAGRPPPHPGKLPFEPFLRGVRSEGPREPGRGAQAGRGAATQSWGAAAQEETQGPPGTGGGPGGREACPA